MRFRVCVESGKQCLDCACAVGLGFGPLVFTLWPSLGSLVICNVFFTSFGVPLGPHFPRSEKFGAGRRERRHPVNCIQEQRPCILVPHTCFRSATGLSTCSLVGSSLEPAAGSTSPSASTQPRAVLTCFLGLCGTLHGLVVSRWHFGWPWGSIVAPWASTLTHMGYSWDFLGTLGGPWDFILMSF